MLSLRPSYIQVTVNHRAIIMYHVPHTASAIKRLYIIVTDYIATGKKALIESHRPARPASQSLNEQPIIYPYLFGQAPQHHVDVERLDPGHLPSHPILPLLRWVPSIRLELVLHLESTVRSGRHRRRHIVPPDLFPRIFGYVDIRRDRRLGLGRRGSEQLLGLL